MHITWHTNTLNALYVRLFERNTLSKSISLHLNHPVKTYLYLVVAPDWQPPNLVRMLFLLEQGLGKSKPHPQCPMLAHCTSVSSLRLVASWYVRKITQPPYEKILPEIEHQCYETCHTSIKHHVTLISPMEEYMNCSQKLRKRVSTTWRDNRGKPIRWIAFHQRPDIRHDHRHHRRRFRAVNESTSDHMRQNGRPISVRKLCLSRLKSHLVSGHRGGHSVCGIAAYTDHDFVNVGSGALPSHKEESDLSCIMLSLMFHTWQENSLHNYV